VVVFHLELVDEGEDGIEDVSDSDVVQLAGEDFDHVRGPGNVKLDYWLFRRRGWLEVEGLACAENGGSGGRTCGG
jgi:hypothetical protein